jgi:hypothetical protein
LYTSRVGSTGNPTWPVDEIPEQIRRTRANAGASGHIHFSEKGLRTARETAVAAAMVIGAVGPRAGEPACICGAATPGGGALTSAADSARAVTMARSGDSLRMLAARRDSMVAAVAQLYSEPALVPSSPWLDRTPPAAPRATLVRDRATGGTTLRLQPAAARDVRYWVIQRESDAGWVTSIRPGWERDIMLATPQDQQIGRVFVRAVDRTGNESRAVLAR